MSRLSLRLRLTLAFGLLMAVVLATIGLIVYRLFLDDLNSTIDRSLAARSEELGALVSQNPRSPAAALDRVSNEEDDFAQVLAADGRLLASTPQVTGERLLGAQVLHRAARAGVFAGHGPVAELDGSLRLHAERVRTARGPLIVLAGTSMGERDESLQTLAELLAIGGAIALVLASVAGYAVATGALRPVEAMRRRAATISRGDSRQRLPVAHSGDEIARLGTTLNEMLDRLSDAFARERRFVADASHELRTPLTILRAEVELALKQGRSPEELRRALESVGEESDRLVHLAEDLLVLARLDRGRLPVRPEACDAEELLQAVAARFQERARRRGTALHASAPSGLVVFADRLRLEQALGNLLDNALRHAAREVCISAVDGPLVELHVRDDGDGFESEIIERAFERFVRGRRERTGTGAGLGLAIVAAIAESHGGRVRAANLAGGGADVWIELRADAPAVRAVEPVTAA